ncbi:MAG TPA: DUF1328 domain-containing protein [Burkholderiales bacterium]
MKPYAIMFGVAALIAACFTDNGIQPGIAKVGRWSLVIFSVLFVITEGIFLAS